jgi:chitodextrinase
MAGSPAAAKAMSRDAMTDLVVALAPAPRAFAGLAAGAGAGRIVGVLGLAGGRYAAGRWRAAIATANKHELLDLAVRPAGRKSGGALLRFLSQLAKQAGADRSAPARPAPAVAGSGPDSVSLGWPAAGAKDGVATYGLYRDGARAGTTAGRTGSFGGLSCGAHVLEVDAVDRAGNRSAKSAVTAGPSGCGSLEPAPLAGLPAPQSQPDTTPPPPPPPVDTTAPSAPTGLHETAATLTSVALAWSPSTDAVGVTGYRVLRDGALVQATSATSLTVSGLACETSYAFAVEAYDAAGNTSPRTTLTAETATCPGPPPTDLAVAETTRVSITLTWNAPLSGDPVAYRVYRGGTLVKTVASTTAIVEGLACGTSYSLAVEAVDAAGAASSRATLDAATEACPDTTPPTPPGGLTVTWTTAASISLAWTASSDAVGVAGYRVYGGGELLETTAGTSITIDLECGRTVTFGVRAFDAAGNESAPAQKTASTLPCPDEVAPTMPENLAASQITPTGLTLSWSASQDAVGVTGYSVYSEGELIGSPTATSLPVTGLLCDTRYAFGVEARDAAGNVSERAFLLGRTAACEDLEPPTRPGNLRRAAATLTSVTAGWDASTDDIGVAGYRVSFDGGPATETEETTATFDKLTCGSRHQVEVEAFDAKGRTSERATLTTGPAECDVTPPSPPGGLAVASRDQRSIVLEWAVAADDWRTARYYVDHDGVMAGATPDTSLVVPGLACGTSYELGVRAFDASGNGSGRGTLTAATAACPGNEPEQPPADLFIAPAGSDQAPCTQAAPCRSFERAYLAGSPGDVVEAAAGDYGAQRILGVPGRSGPAVTIRPAEGARVSFDQITLGDVGDDNAIGPAHLTLRRMQASFRQAEPGGGNQGGIFVGPGSSHITLDDMDAGSFQAVRASHLTVRGGDYGPCDAVPTVAAAQTCGNNVLDVTTDVTIDGARFHDYRFDETCLTVEGVECHWECMYVNGGERVTIRNSRFYGCTIFDIFTTIAGPLAAEMGHKDLTIENNWFATPWIEDENGGAAVRQSAVSLSWCQNSDLGYRDVRLRFNSFEASTGIELDQNPVCTFENVAVTGNLLAWDGCHDVWSFAYNVWSTQLRTWTCSDTEQIAGEHLPYAHPRGGATMDFHLEGPAGPADDIAPAAACPPEDADGEPRAGGGACDAGADERGA